MHKVIRIGTRDSELALWQANRVQRMLNELEYKTQIVPIKSTGDIILNKPIYELGITGVFTRNLDVALLNNEIDLVINTTEGKQSIEDSSSIRQSALRSKTFCTTTMFGAFAVMEALKTDEDDWVYTPLQEIN
jgi:hydroxymethylbilane synthase